MANETEYTLRCKLIADTADLDRAAQEQQKKTAEAQKQASTPAGADEARALNDKYRKREEEQKADIEAAKIAKAAWAEVDREAVAPRRRKRRDDTETISSGGNEATIAPSSKTVTPAMLGTTELDNLRRIANRLFPSLGQFAQLLPNIGQMVGGIFGKSAATSAVSPGAGSLWYPTPSSMGTSPRIVPGMPTFTPSGGFNVFSGTAKRGIAGSGINASPTFSGSMPYFQPATFGTAPRIVGPPIPPVAAGGAGAMAAGGGASGMAGMAASLLGITGVTAAVMISIRNLRTAFARLEESVSGISKALLAGDPVKAITGAVSAAQGFVRVAFGPLLGAVADRMLGVISTFAVGMDQFVQSLKMYNGHIFGAARLYDMAHMMYMRGLAKAVEPLATAWIKVKLDILNAMSGLAESLKPIVPAVTWIVRTAGDIFVKAIKGMSFAVDAIVFPFKSIKTILDGVGISFTTLATVLFPPVLIFRQMKGVLGVLVDAISAAAVAILRMSAWVIDKVPLMGGIATDLNKMADKLSGKNKEPSLQQKGMEFNLAIDRGIRIPGAPTWSTAKVQDGTRQIGAYVDSKGNTIDGTGVADGGTGNFPNRADGNAASLRLIGGGQSAPMGVRKQDPTHGGTVGGPGQPKQAPPQPRAQMPQPVAPQFTQNVNVDAPIKIMHEMEVARGIQMVQDKILDAIRIYRDDSHTQLLAIDGRMYAAMM